jgi:hypothetical protein
MHTILWLIICAGIGYCATTCIVNETSDKMDKVAGIILWIAFLAYELSK